MNMRGKVILGVALAALCAVGASNAQIVSRVVNSTPIAGIIGLGTGVATLLAGTSSGTVGLVGTTSPTLVTPVLGAATATSINFGGSTLSTYVASTWSPAITGATTPGTGQTYTIQVGSYEQIGRAVTARFTIIMSSVGTASGNLQLSLPVAAANVTNDFGTCYVGIYALASSAALTYGVVGVITPNTSIVTLYTNGAVGQSQLSVANLGAAGQLAGTCFYRAS